MRKFEITVTGLVQGIGYRPFVAELAEKLNIVGNVRNDGGIVIVQIWSDDRNSVDDFARRLCDEAPWGAIVQTVKVSELLEDNEAPGGFSIIKSGNQVKNIPYIPADIATCDRCAGELLDMNNRRYRHGFISCVSCGPRYSIIEVLPYDRPRITMKGFDLCLACEKEYTSQGNIRRHAQTICCPDCGPAFNWKLIGESGDAGYISKDRLDEAIVAAAELIKAGGIVAMKDIGGYHLVCDPTNEQAVRLLRQIKAREAKPFAVCFPNIESVKEFCNINELEQSNITGSSRPIVLLGKKNDIEKDKAFAENVCGNSHDIGAMLPCNPQQLLLTKECGPLVMTSGNGSGELLIIDDNEMEMWVRAHSENVSIGILSHNRPILTPLDDSIVRVVNNRTMIIRRARGYVPQPIDAGWAKDRSIFAAGGDLKSAFCFIEEGNAYLSSHLGDLVDEGSQREYVKQANRMKELFGFLPKAGTCDKHPGYYSKELVQSDNIIKSENDGIEVEMTEIQHHKAHVASVVAEHNLSGDIIGFAFDGTGYGDDGSIWGSEIFYWESCEKTGQSGMRRIGHIKEHELIGGNEGARNADTILKGYLSACQKEGDSYYDMLISRALQLHINTVKSTSMGRLFDAVSALLNCCHYNSYEGQAPIELENLARTAKTDEPILYVNDLINSDNILDTDAILSCLIKMQEKNENSAKLARGFINLISEYIISVCISERDKRGALKVVLSGGTFNNRILLDRTIRILEEKGFEVFVNEKLPCSDGGLCLGQAYLACMEAD